MLRASLLASLLVVSFGAVLPASAAEQSSNFQSTSSVVPSCAITQVRDVTWSSYDPVGAGATQKTRSQFGGLTVRCTLKVMAKYGASQGLNAAAGSTCAAPLRNMKSANGDLLPYRLNHAAQDNVANVLGCEPTVNMRTLDFSQVNEVPTNAIGYIDPGVAAAVGEYSDTVTAIILF